MGLMKLSKVDAKARARRIASVGGSGSVDQRQRLAWWLRSMACEMGAVASEMGAVLKDERWAERVDLRNGARADEKGDGG